MKKNYCIKAASAAILFFLPGPSEAFWRLPCRGRTGVARIDPLMAPGKVSDHVHVVHGSGNFGETADQASLRQSNCTSCAVTQDKSAYWTPALYFKYANGTTTLVEQVGGMLAYYLLYGENVTAFPNNFRMIAGDQFQRNFTWPVPDPPKSDWSGAQESQFALQQKAIGFNCLNYNAPPEPSLHRHFLPEKSFLDANCLDGVRFELMFPSCWNGKDVDSPDHKSHMAYPSLVMDGDCPEGFETRLVSLFYETIWNTYAFKDDDGEFVISNGDPTGFGYHGDFIQGWDPDFLQQAVDTCTSLTGIVNDCEIFDIQDDETMGECQFAVPDALKNENVFWDTDGIPGNVPIQSGPAYATKWWNTSATATGSSATSSCTSEVPAVSSNVVPTTTSSAPATYTTVDENVEFDIVVVQQEVVVLLDDNGEPVATTSGSVRTMTTSTSTTSTVVTELVEQTGAAQEPAVAKRDQLPGHLRPPQPVHKHGHAHNRRRDYQAGVGGWF
ncbi:hypothetical protein VTN77DRAFT_942 [Rasamsonia byssochlamydoides]|uniref:uncharacterized protein n=1 Tax=Rasamsonia byssochlamydoides TaxID=89139 RepID=UPI003742D82B